MIRFPSPRRKAREGVAEIGTVERRVFVDLSADGGGEQSSACSSKNTRPRGDFLTYGLGHYETWSHWRRDKTVDPARRAIVQAYEYEDWPLGRIVFDRSRAMFVLHANRKLMTSAACAGPQEKLGSLYRIVGDQTAPVGLNRWQP